MQLSPDYVGIELGIGESLLVKAIAESTGRSLALIKGELKKEGDLGLVAEVHYRLAISESNSYLIFS
jgi:DNA ligase-1